MANVAGHADRIGEPGAVIRYGRDGLEMVSLIWDLQPAEHDGRPFEVVRAEGRQFQQRRGLAPASEFFISRRGRQFRFSLMGGDHFYLAAIWRPATPGWRAAYAVLTVNAGEDVEAYSERQMVVILRDQRMGWLDGSLPDAALLRALPKGTFQVEEYDADAERQPQLSL